VRIIFHPNGWDDYLYWQRTDKKILKKINSIIKEISRTPYEGIGKPESLKFDLTGFWSRRIDQEHRVVYRVDKDELHILACRYHY
jgi:toxin YoeB